MTVVIVAGGSLNDTSGADLVTDCDWRRRRVLAVVGEHGPGWLRATHGCLQRSQAATQFPGVPAADRVEDGPLDVSGDAGVPHLRSSIVCQPKTPFRGDGRGQCAGSRPEGPFGEKPWENPSLHG